MENIQMSNEKYDWTEMSLSDLDEFLGVGDRFSFRFNNKNYFIQGFGFDNEALGRVGFYYIENETSEYPENKKAQTPDEFKSLPFIEGKTIIERFDELRFFNE